MHRLINFRAVTLCSLTLIVPLVYLDQILMGFECLILGTTEGETGDADVLNATSIKKDQIFLSQNSSVHQDQQEVRILILSLVPLSNLICATPSAEMPYSSSFLCIYIAMAKNCSRNYGHC